MLTCVIKLQYTIINSDNSLLPVRHQAFIWTNAGLLLVAPLGTNYSEIWMKIQYFSKKKLDLKMSSAKWQPFSSGLNVLSTGVTSLVLTHQTGLIVRLYKKNLEDETLGKTCKKYYEYGSHKE